MDFWHFPSQQWLLAGVAALMIGMTKSGFSGMGMLVVILMADAMAGHVRESTGVVLPLLLCGDLLAVRTFKRHVQWPILLKMLLPATAGIVIGYFWMRGLGDTGFKPVIGWIILLLTALHLLRQSMPARFQNVPHSPWFVWPIGIAAGVTTMLANAAGPVVTLFFLAANLPKLELVGTAALFFLTVNLIKVPFSASQGLITPGSLVFNAMLVPLVVLGLVGGRFLLHRLNQASFEKILLILTALSALRLIFG